MEEDKKLHRLMSESFVEIPFADFEDRLMVRIRKEAREKRSMLHNMRLSWLFFTIGALFGIGATVLLPFIKHSFFNFEIKYFQIPALLIITGVLVWQMEAMLKLSFRNSKKNKV